MARQAMSEAERQARRDEMLIAASRLFRERRELPPVADIARAAGLAKGTVYLYFSTKEEIFIGLLEAEFRTILANLGPLLAALPTSVPVAAQHFAHNYSQAIVAQPELLPLAALCNGVLEQNLPFEAMASLKVYLATELNRCGKLLEARFPQLAAGGGVSLLLHSHALSLGLWQSLSYPPALVAQLQHPDFRVLRRDFASELEPSIRALWLGTLQR